MLDIHLDNFVEQYGSEFLEKGKAIGRFAAQPQVVVRVHGKNHGARQSGVLNVCPLKSRQSSLFCLRFSHFLWFDKISSERDTEQTIENVSHVTIYMEEKGCAERSRLPVISIQNDWEEAVFCPGGRAWISSKVRGETSVHSKLKGGEGNTNVECASEEFAVLSCDENVIEVRDNRTGHACVFVAPIRTHSGLHAKRTASLDVTDGGLAVSAAVTADNEMLVWNVVTGQTLQDLRGHVGSIYKCRFFPSGLVILSAGADAVLKIWSAETGDCPVTLVGHKGPVNDFCPIDRGRNVVSVSGDGTAKLWDCGTSACLATLFHENDAFNCCAVGVLSGDCEDMVRDQPFRGREVGTKNKILVIGSEGGRIYGIAIFSRTKLFTTNLGSPVNVLLLTREKIVAGCQNGDVKVSSTSGIVDHARTIWESGSAVLCGCLYKNRGFFIGRSDGTVTYYDSIALSQKRMTLTGPDFDSVSDICVVNNSMVFTSCRDGKIRQYDLNKPMSSFFFDSN